MSFLLDTIEMPLIVGKVCNFFIPMHYVYVYNIVYIVYMIYMYNFKIVPVLQNFYTLEGALQSVTDFLGKRLKKESPKSCEVGETKKTSDVCYLKPCDH